MGCLENFSSVKEELGREIRSPLLFVLAAEFLQILVNRAASSNLLVPPLPQPNEDFPIVQYADDILLIMQADARQLLFLKALLASFAESTGLKVNYSKSQMLAINVSQEKIEHLANTFGCSTGSLPFTYLGLPMGTTKPKMEDLTPLMDGVERCFSGSETWLSYSGRLQMVNAAMTPIVTYILCTIKLPRGVIENIDRMRKQFLWRGNSEKTRGGNLVAWETVQKPKDKGGLGVINLRLHNDALLMKHLHKFYNHADIPWIQLIWFKYYQDKVPHASREVGSFWWKDVMRLNNLYRSCSRCIVGDGSTVCFWEDRWTDNILSTDFPRIASFSKSEHVSVQQVMQTQDMEDMFHLPLSVQALEELNDLQTVIQEVTYDENRDDKWQPLCGIDFSARKYYEHIYGTLEAHPIFQQIHKSRCTPRVKFFVWLVLVDRLNTKTMLSRRHIYMCMVIIFA